MGLQDQIINTLLISIPEEFFIIFVTLRLMKKERLFLKEYLKENIFKIMFISVIPLAIMSNTLVYLKTITGLEFLQTVNDLSGIIVAPLSLIGIIGYTNKKDLVKVYGSVIVAFFIFAITEMVTLLIIFYGLNTDVSIVNQSPYLNSILVLPERFLQYGYIWYKISKINSMKNDLKDKDVFVLVMENKGARRIVITVTLLSFIIIAVLSKLVYIDKIFIEYSMKGQMFMLVTIISLVICINWVVWLLAFNIYQKEKYIQFAIKEGYYEEDDI